jgi:tetratricopeptide (TPR) repeat protein
MLTWLIVGLLAAAPQAQGGTPSARAGWEALARKDGDAAAAAFRAALDANPTDARSITGAGLAAQLQGRSDLARDYFTRAIQANPRYPDAYDALGRLEYSQGNLAPAIDAYERLAKLVPRDEDVAQRLERWRKEAALHDTLVAQPTGRFTVLFEGETQQAIATRVSNLLEDAYDRLTRKLNAVAPNPVTVILYTGEQFRDITKSPSWAAAAYDGRIRVPVRGALDNPGELDRVVTHEFVHAVIHQAYPRTPKWLNEGLATYLEPGDHTGLLRRLRGAGDMIPLAELNKAFSAAEGEKAAVAYAQAYAATRFLSERLGDKLPVLIQYLNDGMPIDEALLLFNLQVTDLEQAWTRR